MRKPPLPRWDCYNEAERRQFEEWTNTQLLALKREEGETFYLENGRPASNSVRFAIMEIAAKAHDYKALIEMANTPELSSFASELLKRKRKRGREIGDARPSDLLLEVRCIFTEAARDVDRIYHIWARHFGRRNRSQAPTATDIAVRHWHIPDELEERFITFRNNRSADDRWEPNR